MRPREGERRGAANALRGGFVLLAPAPLQRLDRCNCGCCFAAAPEVEALTPAKEQGRYLAPDLCGQPASASISLPSGDC